MWVAIFLCALAILFLFRLIMLHRIEHRNGDTWDREDDNQ
jgi:hypothetical protein